jgi:DNA-binding GntR family transcriptional regulator
VDQVSLLLPVDRPQSLKGLSYTIIKDAILILKFKLGQALSHQELPPQLKISETPMQDAPPELEREGFVC